MAPTQKTEPGLFVVGGVFFGEGFQVFGKVVDGVNGVVIARGYAGAAGGALVGIDKELGNFGNLASSFAGWMQPMGQAPMQFSSLVQVSVMTKAICKNPPTYEGAIAGPTVSEGKVCGITQECVR